MRTFATFLMALAVSGCSSEPEQNPIANAAADESYGQQVDALPDPARRAVFLRAIRDAGLDCQHVATAQAAGRYRGLPVWRATCDGGTVWTIVIAESGTAQILNANEANLITDGASDPAPAQTP